MTPRGEDQQAAREARLDELHDKLTTAVDQVVSGEDWKRALAFAANFRSRSFNNTLLIWAQHAAAYETWLHHYNHHRPHTGIGGQTPSARVHNVTGKYS
ncbi:hypothetical protein TPCV2_09270 [Cutibacterium avidum]|nr:integrase core domain-containing protein [Cutibacterium avidum]BCQ01668.1 hypothetical protein TPCV4_01120 [Cutibacterium avidum]